MTSTSSAKPSSSQTDKKEKEEEKKIEQVHKHQKRGGTSGIKGQLYETKLLSLIYLRAIHDERTEEFYLATNIDDIGIFDDIWTLLSRKDPTNKMLVLSKFNLKFRSVYFLNKLKNAIMKRSICLKAKIKEFEKPITVFIQAKHRENDKLLTLNSKKDLANCFDSYLQIKKKFQASKDDVLFKGGFNETDCSFVFYTTTKDDGNSTPCEDNLVKYLNNIIGTGSGGLKPNYTEEDRIILYQQVLEDQLVTLAQKIGRHMFEESNNLMNDELMAQYHVILARNVFDISEIQPQGHRMAKFREDFFRPSQKSIQLFKDTLCSVILEKRKINIKNETQDLLSNFLSDPDNRTTLSKLIRGGVITFKNGYLVFRDKIIPQPFKQELDTINMYKKEVRNEAVELAVRECKPTLDFKVPAVFGNKDLAIRGSDAKINKRMDHLCQKLIDLIEKSKPNKIITIDENLNEGLLQINGGLASAIGNIFVSDDKTKLFKFCESSESLENIAQRFYAKLENRIEDMHEYKFDIRVKMFPKLSLERTVHDEDVMTDFMNKLILYTSQGDETEVERKIKEEIEKYQVGFRNPEKRSEAIFLKYHDEIQKWWMTPKEGSCLTKDGKLYEIAVENASVVNVMPDIKFSQRVFFAEKGRIITSYDPEERRNAGGESESE